MKQKLVITMLSFVMACAAALAQSDSELLDKLMKEDPKPIEAISMYPADVRNSILEAMKYPEVIVKLEALRKKNNEAFKGAVSYLSQDRQEMIWNLTRYPGLINKLVAGGDKTRKQVKEILEAYPQEVHLDAYTAMEDDYLLLKKISKLNSEASSEYTGMIAGYPQKACNAFGKLIQFPEVIDILYNSMQTTVLVGDMYKRNPEWIRMKTDSLNLEVARANAKEVEEWKRSLEQNPQAKEELKKAAEEYAKQSGNDQASTERVYTQVSYYVNPYPYWFGYPHWHSHWYPYPIWYDWGFYYGPFGEIIVYSIPSYEFGYWYFYHHHHHHHYPHLSVLIIDHHHHYHDHHDYHYGPRHTSFRKASSQWQKENEQVMPRDWAAQPIDKKVEWVKEYGHFSEEYEQVKPDHAGQKPTKVEYIRQKADKYPLLSQAPAVKNIQKPGDIKQPAADQEPTQVEKPVQQFPKTKPAEQKPVEKPKPAPTTKPVEKSKPAEKPKTADKPKTVEQPRKKETPAQAPKQGQKKITPGTKQ